ncbi:MAG: hypothetical protein RJA61_247 [Candidatus Parcubacteria bacterium]|jgi:hypothetical protein
MVIQALQKVFRKPIYVIFALVVSILVFVFAVWLPNIRLITNIVSSPDVSLSSKIELPVSLLGSINTNFTTLSASYTIAIAILFGIYVSMMVYFLKHRIENIRQSGIAAGFLGIMSGIVGVGCAACGAFLLTSLLSIIGAGGLLVLLPLHGSEFGILGTLLLVFAVFRTAKQIESPLVCKI